ncbi:protein kinase [Planctomycetota bacterium]
MNCPSCNSEMPEEACFCPSCGTELAQPTTPVTEPFEPGASSASSSDSGEHGRFLPGTVLAKRYRIVGLLGKGGMGEIYRADDLKLGQAVALKLLPERLASDPKRLEYFHNEVRLARQVSHPNVCRVYDIGEVDGQHYLSMEYIDGEDLAGLIRRIGRLPPDKGIDVARQLCAGLAAAHAAGVLHRDLKPANVMLDGRGRVRITDFGLARLSDEQGGVGEVAGTPAYMAPEQLAGREVTEQSDVYSLGLVLFEVFTGQPAFQAETAAELLRLRQDSTPSAPSGIVAEIDVDVESVILQCLEKEASRRPQTALAVSAALPGGDPLAAALAAGQTPSPEMVAAAGESGLMDPPIAGAWLGALLVGLLATALLSDGATVHDRAGLSEKPDALELIARNIIREVGYDTPPKDSHYGFQYDTAFLRSLRKNKRPSSHEQAAGKHTLSGMHFWYRQSPYDLIPLARANWVVSYTDPPSTVPGMVGVRLDPEGRLIEFAAVPHENAADTELPETENWERFFAWAGLDRQQFVEQVGEEWTGLAPAATDCRLVWKGVHPVDGGEIHIEAASLRGAPVTFRVREACPETGSMPVGIPPSDRQPFKDEAMLAGEWTVVLIVLVVAVFVARRSLRLGRSDRKGALGLGAFSFSLILLCWLFEASHVPQHTGEIALLFAGIFNASFFTLNMGLTYLAFEPYLRRYWPGMLISWNRLWAGQLRDPAVGRDLLIGATTGVWCGPAMQYLAVRAPDWLGPAQPAWKMLPDTLLGGRHLIAVTFYCCSAVGVGLIFALVLLLLRMLLRKWWLWAPGYVIFVLFLVSPPERSHFCGTLPWVVFLTALLLLYIRLGLLAAIGFFFAFYILNDFPLTGDLGSWYWGSSLYALSVVAALGVYGFYTSVARPVQMTRQALARQS